MLLIPRMPSVAPLCFFLISVSYKLAWTAISSLLSQYSEAYGPGILLQLNVAYFLPSIPVLMLQTAFNDRMDRRLGLPCGALLRYCLGLGALVGLTRHFPALTAGSERALLGTTVLVGMSYGVAFGTSYQMASKYPAGATVALTTGFVSSGPVVLLLDLALKRGPFYSPEGLEQLFGWVAVITAGGLLAAVLLVLGSWRMLSAGAPHRVELKVPYRAPYSSSSASYGGGGKDSANGATNGGYGSERLGGGGGPYVRHRPDAGGEGSAAVVSVTANGHSHHLGNRHGGGGGGSKDGHHAITLDFGGLERAPSYGSHNGTSGGGGGGGGDHHHLHVYDAAAGGMGASALSGDESKVAKRDLPLLRLAGRIAPAAAAITASVGTSMLIFPFFTYMHSTGLLGVRLAQVLFYVRLVGDIVGRMVPRRMQVTTVRGLLFWAVVKVAMVPLLFAVIFTPAMTGGDGSACVAVALFWVLSGYLNTCSYLVAPSLVPPGQKARASGLMTVAFQSACFGALLLAAAVQHWRLGPGMGHEAAAAAAAAVTH